MYPQIICHVMGSVDGRLLTDRWFVARCSSDRLFVVADGRRGRLAAV